MTTEHRQIFVLRLRPEPGVDALRALRIALKLMLRRCGLRAIDVREERTEERQTRNEHFGAVLELLTRAGKGECDV